VRTEKILVTGATGKVGRELVPLLLEAGLEVKAGTRDPARARAVFGGAVEVVELNYWRTETYDHAVAWADRVFLVPPPFSPDAHEAIVPFLDWAVSARVRHVVLLSGMTVGDVGELSLHRVEAHLQRQDVGSTILRPNLYMQNFHPGFLSTPIREGGRIRVPAGDGRVSLVDVRDVAAVAAMVLRSAEHAGAHVLTGGEALGMEEAAGIIAEAADRAVRYDPVSDEEFRGILGEEAWREDEIEVILGLFGSVRRGWREPVHPDVELILGREPLRFDSFARENAHAWR
jgi:uncharacterized protein YbjT (DUF2867 family)